MSRDTDFVREKAAVLRFVRVLERAQTAAELRALLMADLGSPFHSFDPVALAAKTENLGSALARLMCEDLDGEVAA